MIRGVILDVDGTLLDSNDAHARAWKEAMAEHGYRIPLRKVRRLIGMGTDHLLPEAIGIDSGSECGQSIARRKDELYTEAFDQIRTIPGARELVRQLHRAGLPITVATSSRDEDLRRALEKIGIAEFVELETSADEAEESKPSPDLVESALAKLDLKGPYAVMIGDTPYDIEAALRARVPTIAFTCGGWDASELRGAKEIYRGPAELLDRIHESMLAPTLDARLRAADPYLHSNPDDPPREYARPDEDDPELPEYPSAAHSRPLRDSGPGAI